MNIDAKDMIHLLCRTAEDLSTRTVDDRRIGHAFLTLAENTMHHYGICGNDVKDIRNKLLQFDTEQNESLNNSTIKRS